MSTPATARPRTPDPGPVLDIFTILERRGKIADLNVTILGDILYSRVARSNIWALLKLGANVTLCGPATLAPRVFEQMGCRVTYNIEEAVANADIISLLRIQHERQRKTMFPSLNEYSSLFGLNRARLALTKPDALIMHPGPINRGVEIDSDIADCGRSVILEQVTNGLAVRMAVLLLVAGGKSFAGNRRRLNSVGDRHPAAVRAKAERKRGCAYPDHQSSPQSDMPSPARILLQTAAHRPSPMGFRPNGRWACSASTVARIAQPVRDPIGESARWRSAGFLPP